MPLARVSLSQMSSRSTVPPRSRPGSALPTRASAPPRRGAAALLAGTVIRRGKRALTHFWWMSCLCGADDARLEEIELPAAIHLTFHELQLGDLPLCLAV